MTTLTQQPPRVPIGTTPDGSPVLVSREWWDYLAVGLFNRAGGATGVSTTELVESAFEDAGIQEMQALIFTNEQGQNQQPVYEHVSEQEITNFAELAARVDALTAEVAGLKQGTL